MFCILYLMHKGHICMDCFIEDWLSLFAYFNAYNCFKVDVNRPKELQKTKTVHSDFFDSF